MNYIYIIQIRELLDTNIYKIGKTKQENLKRFNQYPKGSKLISQYDCFDCDIVEKNIIHMFKSKYVQRTEYGVEYFEGYIIQMKDDIYALTKENILQNTQNTQTTPTNIDWVQDDILLGGQNQYIKFIEEDTGGVVKTPMILYLNKKKKCEKFTNTLIHTLSYMNTWETLLGQYYNINDKTFIDMINASKIKININIKLFDIFVKHSFIDSSIDYTDIITYTNDTYEKILIIFGNTIVNDRYVISDIQFDNKNKYIHDEECTSYGTLRKYQITCLTTIPNIRFVDDMTITLIKSRWENYFIVGTLFKNNEVVDIQNEKPYIILQKNVKFKGTTKDYHMRYNKIITQLKQITPKNIESSYFDSHVYTKYIEVDLHNYINEYFNNIYGEQQNYPNVGKFMDINCKSEVMNICFNDILYKKLTLEK